MFFIQFFLFNQSTKIVINAEASWHNLTNEDEKL